MVPNGVGAPKLDKKEIEHFYKNSFQYAMKLLEFVPRPQIVDDDEDGESQNQTQKLKKLPKRLFPRWNDKQPARTVEELQAKLAILKGKQKLPYKEKLSKKGLKDRLKKKQRKETRKLVKAMEKKVKKESTEDMKPVKPVFNEEGKMIFSKFDFSDIGEVSKNTALKDPMIALKKIKKEKEMLNELKESGEVDKAVEIAEKKAWKSAILKSEGVKVKDDPELLKKTIKKQKYKKEKSVEKWKARETKIKKDQEDKQKKRLESIHARAKQKKLGKMKKAAKRGRVVAGF